MERDKNTLFDTLLPVILPYLKPCELKVAIVGSSPYLFGK
jgi:hypothetical protein